MRKRAVVRHRDRTHEIGSDLPGAEHGLLVRVDIDALERPGLAHVQVGVREARDHARVVEERVLVLPRRGERELETHVLLRIADVVDIHVVGGVVVEAREVRAAVGLDQRHPVTHDRHGVGRIAGHPGVEIGVVGKAVLARAGRLAVARGHGGRVKE